MPRDLADVLHYFIPDVDAPAAPGQGAPLDAAAAATAPGPAPDPEGRSLPRATALPPLPILGVPIGDRDVVRAALTWNLAVETARLGGSTMIVAPESDIDSPLWPEPGVGPLGTELVFRPARNLGELYREAADLAVSRAESARRGGTVFVRIPPSWLEAGKNATNPIRWLLLLTSSNRRDLDEAYDLAHQLLRANPRAEVGVTIHGVDTIAEARRAYEHLSRRCETQLGLFLISYGLLVDDLHVYRAIAAQRPIGLAHPQAPATRALMDVAQLVYEDARSRVLG